MTGLFASLSAQFAPDAANAPQVQPRPRARYEGDPADDANDDGFGEEQIETPAAALPPLPRPAPAQSTDNGVPPGLVDSIKPPQPTPQFAQPRQQVSVAPPPDATLPAPPPAPDRRHTPAPVMAGLPPVEPRADHTMPRPEPAAPITAQQTRAEPRPAATPAPQGADVTRITPRPLPPQSPDRADQPQVSRAEERSPPQPQAPASMPEATAKVEIRIGRIEVTSATPPAPAPRAGTIQQAAPPRAAPPGRGLTDYLGWRRT